MTRPLCDVRDMPYGDPCWKCGGWHLEEEAARKAGTFPAPAPPPETPDRFHRHDPFED